jgi:hypothetical protein
MFVYVRLTATGESDFWYYRMLSSVVFCRYFQHNRRPSPWTGCAPCGPTEKHAPPDHIGSGHLLPQYQWPGTATAVFYGGWEAPGHHFRRASSSNICLTRTERGRLWAVLCPPLFPTVTAQLVTPQIGEHNVESPATSRVSWRSRRPLYKRQIFRSCFFLLPAHHRLSGVNHHHLLPKASSSLNVNIKHGKYLPFLSFIPSSHGRKSSSVCLISSSHGWKSSSG